MPNKSPFTKASLPFSERRIILITLDTLALNASLLFILSLRADIPFGLATILQHPIWFILWNLLWFPIAAAFDLYDLSLAGNLRKIALAVLKAGAITEGIYLLIPFLTPSLPPSRWQLLVMATFPLLGLIAGRGLYIWVLGQPNFRLRVLIYGAGWAGTELARTLLEHSDVLYQIIGFIDDEPDLFDADIVFQDIPDRENGKKEVKLRVLGNRGDIYQLAKHYQVDTLVLAVTHGLNGEALQIMTDCLEMGLEVTPMPVLYEQIMGRIPIQHVGDQWSVSMPIHHPGTGAFQPFVKRIFDLVSAGVGAILLGIALPFIALAVYIDSPGPIFYTQKRVGKGGKIFRVYKFRSMIPKAEKNGAVWADKNDARVTRIGRLLRKTHIDEFPQFFNILKGEMSAVGPRPERPEFVEELAKEIPFYRVRHAVKPGMAGWGLVKQGYGSSKEDALLKLQYDLYYIKHQSLWMDIVILLKTIIDTLTFGGR